MCLPWVCRPVNEQNLWVASIAILDHTRSCQGALYYLGSGVVIPPVIPKKLQFSDDVKVENFHEIWMNYLIGPKFVGTSFRRPKFSSAQVFVGPSFRRPKFSSAQVFVGPNFRRPKFSSAQIFVGPNFRRPKFSSAQIFVGPNFRRPKFSSAQIFVGSNFRRPKFSSAQIFVGPNFRHLKISAIRADKVWTDKILKSAKKCLQFNFHTQIKQ